MQKPVSLIRHSSDMHEDRTRIVLSVRFCDETSTDQQKPISRSPLFLHMMLRRSGFCRLGSRYQPRFCNCYVVLLVVVVVLVVFEVVVIVMVVIAVVVVVVVPIAGCRSDPSAPFRSHEAVPIPCNSTPLQSAKAVPSPRCHSDPAKPF